MHFIVLTFILVLLFVMIGCSSMNNGPVSGVSGLGIPENEIPNFERAANNGDSLKAKQLYLYYDFVKLDRIKACRWLLVAAKLGDIDSQFNLAKMYLNDERLKNPKLARFWLGEAAKRGDAQALELLRKLAIEDNSDK